MIGEDGLATERVSYFDSMPIVLAAPTRPRGWPAFLRSRSLSAARRAQSSRPTWRRIPTESE